ncbi:MAG: hypothetical protein H6617_08950 [Bdellovibrionaceae bacterium]|nr:hypothetical protein [Bdellovibrionales bacterium]MCB9254795.1 hypothetical protein [Pseudobdellovibrionaceae bacterium]
MLKKFAQIRGRWIWIAAVLFVSYHSWYWFAFAPKTKPHFYSPSFPVSQNFQSELILLRETKRLDGDSESRILHATVQTAKVLQIPAGLLWCLLFQESRLNHRLGMEGNIPSYGLGQFTHFGFQEINYQLNRYSTSNRSHLIRLLGSDVRPISANSATPDSLSSYFSIPTAVVTTGLYLKNRYLHLGSLLERRGIRYDPKLLWLYAVMAYNKGTRGILSFWNAEEKRLGTNRIRQLVTDPDILLDLARDRNLFTAGFARVWDRRRARSYSEELSIHLSNIAACALNPIGVTQ